jgi:hypothetical protein
MGYGLLLSLRCYYPTPDKPQRRKQENNDEERLYAGGENAHPMSQSLARAEYRRTTGKLGPTRARSSLTAVGHEAHAFANCLHTAEVASGSRTG